MPAPRIAPLILAASLLSGTPLALAGVTYQLEPAASSDTRLIITGVVFNDTGSVQPWTPASTLKLTWHTPDGRIFDGEARLVSSPDPVELPVNNFVALRWETTPPPQLRGLVALRVQDQPTLLAFDASGSAMLQMATVTGERAAAPSPAPSEATVTDDAPATAARTPAATSSAFENFRNAISTHEPIYFAVGDEQGLHARFQISFKYRLFNPPDGVAPRFIDHFHLGYTQTALWDLNGESKPFIDTSYNPSLFWRKDALLTASQGRAYLGLATGVEHLSNGKGGDDSRSLNDFFFQPEFNYRFGNGSTLSFAPRIKSYFSTSDNPDYADYTGHVDWKLRWAQDDGLVLDGLYRQGKYGRNTVQLSAAWPLSRTPLKMNGYLYAQYFKGYGDTLLGYNLNSSPRVRVGLALVP